MTGPDLSLDEDRLALVTRGAIMAVAPYAIFDVRGAGSLDCLQGLLTNDLVKPGPGSMTYGALLTPKGMLIVDTWILRRQDAITLVLPLAGREAALETFHKSLPPRLAQLSDRTGEAGAALLLGDQSLDLLRTLPLPMPEPAGRLAEQDAGDGGVTVARPPQGAWFHAMVIGPTAAVRHTGEVFEGAGGIQGTADDVEAARILAGWPAVGAEIDQKTLPQEVRFDELGGISYTKGCYMGQETVARLHFRGHPNRELRGLVWSEPAALADRQITYRGKDVGTVRSTLVLPGRRLGLAPIRREVANGETVTAGGAPASVVPLPFPLLIEDAVG